MKTFKFFAIAIIALFTVVNFSSCDSSFDEEEFMISKPDNKPDDNNDDDFTMTDDDNGEEGAYYLKNLIRSAKTITGSYGLVGDVHDVAAQGTHTEVMIWENAIQDPVANLPKLLSSQQLILSVSI